MRRKKNVKKGIQFCLMVCGASGTGKDSQPSPTTHVAARSFLYSPGRTTFVNTLCGKKVLHAKEADDAASAHLEEGVRIKPVTVGEQFYISGGCYFPLT
jgi:cell division control protein 11